MTVCRVFAALLILCGTAACGNGTDAPVEVDLVGHQFETIETLDDGALTGKWTSPDGNCDTPDFTILRDAESETKGLAVAADFNGWERTGRLAGDRSAFEFIDPAKSLPVRLQDGGLHIAAPSDGLAVLGSRNLFREGVVFRKCAD